MTDSIKWAATADGDIVIVEGPNPPAFTNAPRRPEYPQDFD